MTLVSSSATALTSSELKPLLSQLDQLRNQQKIAGLALLVVSPDEVIWAGGLGVEDWESEKPMTADSLVRIGSITKTFTGLVFSRLQRQGLLDMDKPVKDYLKELPYQNSWGEQGRPVTVAGLLEHTAGLTDMTQREFNHLVPLSLEDALKLDPNSRRLAWPPGLHSSYSNSGAGVAAYVMEQVTGKDFEAYMREQVLKPLNMPSADLVYRDGLMEELVTGYNTDGKSRIPYWHTLYRPFGGLHIRVREMSGLIQMLLNNGRVGEAVFLNREEVTRSEQPSTTITADAGLTYGYGLGNYQSLRDGVLFHGHGGDADGYLAHFAYSRELSLGYFVVINAFQGSTLRRMRAMIERALIGDHEADELPPVAKVENLDQFVGLYREETWRFGSRPNHSVRVTVQGDRLRVTDQQRERFWLLLPTAENLFRRPKEPIATAAFVHHDGDTYLQAGFGNFKRVRSGE